MVSCWIYSASIIWLCKHVETQDEANIHVNPIHVMKRSPTPRLPTSYMMPEIWYMQLPVRRWVSLLQSYRNGSPLFCPLSLPYLLPRGRGIKGVVRLWDEDVVDGDVNELDDETDGTHDEETDADCLGDLHEFALVGLGDMSARRNDEVQDSSWNTVAKSDGWPDSMEWKRK